MMSSGAFRKAYEMFSQYSVNPLPTLDPLVDGFAPIGNGQIHQEEDNEWGFDDEFDEEDEFDDFETVSNTSCGSSDAPLSVLEA